MKKNIRHLFCAGLAGFALAAAPISFGQSTISTSTTMGTVSELDPDTIVVKTESAEPIRYHFTKTTAYVDENGNPVSVETVKFGVPVTVSYEQEGDQMVASKVIVHSAPALVPVAPPDPGTGIEKKSATTTITNAR